MSVRLSVCLSGTSLSKVVNLHLIFCLFYLFMIQFPSLFFLFADSEHSVVLKEISVPLWDQTDCSAALEAQFGSGYSLPGNFYRNIFSFICFIIFFADTALCAGAEHRDACDGDGGGPLVCEHDGQWYQVRSTLRVL